MRVDQLYHTSHFGEACSLKPGEERVDEVKLPLIDGQFFEEEYADLLAAGYWPETMAVEEDKLVLAFSRVACLDCSDCQASRIALRLNNPTDNQVRNIDGANLKIGFAFDINATEHLEVAKKYYAHRHKNTSEDYVSDQWNFYSEHCKGNVCEFRDEHNRLVGAMPVIFYGRSAVATFYYYDPEYLDKIKKLSYVMIAGLAANLKKSDRADYLYCASWTNIPTKLSHKARHSGLEIKESDGWRALSKSEARNALTDYFRAFPPDLPVPRV